MKRIQQKVKDIVDVRVYEPVTDYSADPAKTLAGYHFTDATAELMAKWLEKVAEVAPGKGMALALAGYRGVGKSHFLAVIGAIASHPPLRPRIADSHVQAASEGLLRRHYPCVYIRRGTHQTLVEEIKTSIASFARVSPATLPDSPAGLLSFAVENAGDLPLIVIIDTALERGVRVTRDDGPVLAELAEASKKLRTFLGVALDDDIAGADGPNVAIARTFAIDYLDQEHLYKVVNSHVFPKLPQMQQVLQEIYNDFRAVLPNFRWSEQRFTSLYPLHPAILEIAPFVRLYVHDFALLAFSSSAAERILGRPANSLIGLDEVFDSAEKALRKASDLEPAFAAYDKLNDEVVSKVPVMQRLQAKLVLKALMLLSLNGQGATAGEISSAMLIFDETDPGRAVDNVEKLLKSFVSALPNDVRADKDEMRGVRYRFSVTSKDDLNQALTEEARSVSSDVVWSILRRFIIERFADCRFTSDNEQAGRDAMDCLFRWRGGLRRGRIFWQDRSQIADQVGGLQDPFLDCEIIIAPFKSVVVAAGESHTPAQIYWRPDALRPEEEDTLIKFYAIGTSVRLREEFNDQIRAALHSHSVSVGQILNRIFLDDGRLEIGGFDYNFTEDARSSQTLAELFTIMLEPHFESRYPEHPRFAEVLTNERANTLIPDLYSGSRQKLPEVQAAALAFARPLGLVREENGFLVPEIFERLKSNPAVNLVLRKVETTDGSPVSISSVYSTLFVECGGLVVEAQKLILTALVAQRQIDFVTASGDRIARRSLDLTINWDDIAGITRSSGATYSINKLLRWASIVADVEKLRSFDDPADREQVLLGFKQWHECWMSAAVLQRFNDLPDEVLNTRIWKLSSDCAKTLGAVAESIESVLNDSVTLEDCLNRIADVFSDSEEQYRRVTSDLAVVDSFIEGVPIREKILSYMSACDSTGDSEIEEMRAGLYDLVRASYFNASEASNREMGYLWTKFKRDFVEYYITSHNRNIGDAASRETVAEFANSPEWQEFSVLSDFPILDRSRLPVVRRLKTMLDMPCSADVRTILEEKPACSCSFSLSRNYSWSRTLDELRSAVTAATQSYRRQLIGHKEVIVPAIEGLAKAQPGVQAVKNILAFFRSDGATSNFSAEELRVLQTAVFDSIAFVRAAARPSTGRNSSKRSQRPGHHAETADESILIEL